MSKIFVSLASALAMLTSGCTSMQDVNCRTGERRMTSERLYFGTVNPGGKVEAADWESFLNEVVTPRFPYGLSVCQSMNKAWAKTLSLTVSPMIDRFLLASFIRALVFSLRVRSAI
ncbi:DUF3574 domain-containing protein [Methyloterricola oryzae]|uniref:DUF3574 domain-containing protein n=1 Tax=Methyloterricola oryzae TaxID=1495050 RepID=UPI0009E58FA7